MTPTFWEKTTSDPIALFTLGVVISTIALVISTVLLWRVTRLVAMAAKQSADTAVNAESPAIYVYKIWFDENLFNYVGDVFDSVINVKFENFGRTTAIVREIDIDWRIGPLPDEPIYTNARPYTSSIRPGGVEQVSDNRNRVRLERADIQVVRTKAARLWVYGFIVFDDFMRRRHKRGFVAAWYGSENVELFTDRGIPPRYEYDALIQK